MDRLYTRREVADHLRISTRTLDRWRRDENIPLHGFHVSQRKVLFTEAELRTLVDWGVARRQRGVA
jgi:predicted site-specific integrase-resolvase